MNTHVVPDVIVMDVRRYCEKVEDGKAHSYEEREQRMGNFLPLIFAISDQSGALARNKHTIE